MDQAIQPSVDQAGQAPTPLPIPEEKKTSKKLIITGIILVILLVIFGIGGYFLTLRYQASLIPPVTTDPSPTPTTYPTACTQEAKQCPDGSYVGRAGPSCEFSPCPTNSTGEFCGGIAAVTCPTGYTCKLDGDFPDAGGTCTKQ